MEKDVGWLSLAALLGDGPSPIGKYQLSGSGSWLPLHTPDVVTLWRFTVK